jgi:hypothetical protein
MFKGPTVVIDRWPFFVLPGGELPRRWPPVASYWPPVASYWPPVASYPDAGRRSRATGRRSLAPQKGSPTNGRKRYGELDKIGQPFWARLRFYGWKPFYLYVYSHSSIVIG